MAHLLDRSAVVDYVISNGRPLLITWLLRHTRTNIGFALSAPSARASKTHFFGSAHRNNRIGP